MEFIADIGFASPIVTPFRDAWLAARARLALLMAGTGATAEVQVEAYHGSVVLTGTVPTRQVRDNAERTVRALASVVGVSNQIRVLSAQGARPAGTDRDIHVALSIWLKTARELRGSRIFVAAIYDGVVTLGGTARSVHARRAAFEKALITPGVRRVVSDVALSTSAGTGRKAYAA